MPKERSSRISLLKSWISSEPNNFVIDVTTLKCVPCNTVLEPSNKNDVQKHIKSKAHVLAQAGPSSGSDFKYEITKAFVSSNIPLIKLENPNLKQFLENWTHQEVPPQATLRKWYVDKVYDNTLRELRQEIGNNYVWISVDETMDACGRYIGNFLVGVLNGEFKQPQLLCIKELESTRHDCIVNFVNNSLEFLWNERYTSNKDKVLVFITNEESYMLKAGRILKQNYPNLYHITGIVHGLNRVAEEVRRLFPKVNSLISSVKKIFLKAPKRVKYFQEQCPLIPLPPEPIVTRWNTWLEAAFYYASNFDSISNVISQFDPQDSIHIPTAQDALNDVELKNKLIFIKTNLSVLHEVIRKLETINLSLLESFESLNSVEASISNLQSSAGATIKQKLKSVLEKNPDLEKLKTISNCFKSDNISDINKNLVPLFKYCPLTSIDVERSFSLYKYMLNDRRRNFTMSNLEKHIVINFKHKTCIDDML